MAREGITEPMGSRGRVAAFGSRPYRNGDATRALDSTIAGLRTLGSFAGRPEAELEATTDLSQLVRAAEPGMARYVGDRRASYSALFVAVGARCQTLLARLHRPAGMERVTDPVVASAISAAVADVTGGETSTLLRMAVAAELSASDSGGNARSARNPLSGVLDLYEMGAILTTRRGQPVELALGDGGRVALEWTGGMFTRGAAGRLVVSQDADLAF